MILNYIILAIIIIVMGIAIYLFIKYRKKTISDYIEESSNRKNSLTSESLLRYTKSKIDEYTRESLLDKGYSEAEYKKQKSIRNRIKSALKHCKHGSIQDKQIVKEYITNVLIDYVGEDIDEVIGFNNIEVLTIQDKFDILLYIYKEIENNKTDALTVLVERYNLACEKQIIEDGKTSYIITQEEIEGIFLSEYPSYSLTYRDKMNIITQRVYQQFKGLGVIDEIRDMAIDGIHGGVSGQVDISAINQSYDEYINNIANIAMFYDSVWMFYKGKYIHLAFLSFGSEQELKRVCQNIYSYNKAGQLSENIGFKVNEMQDNSRVVVFRPPFAESWGFFIRKFNLRSAKLDQIVKGGFADDMIDFMSYLVKGARVTAITGAMATGKSTMMMALVDKIYAFHTIRVQETAFELWLRNIYPMRNIFSIKEYGDITGQAGLDVLKKSDGVVQLLGEISSDIIASWMIQMARVASLFTIFTHHAKTVDDLVQAIRNSLLRTNVFTDEKIAEEEVASVLDYNIHLARDADGKRYIEHITEIEVFKSEDYDVDKLVAGNDTQTQLEFMKIQAEYYRRSTDRKTYTTKVIVQYENGNYVFKNKPSSRNIEEMLYNMREEDRFKFKEYLVKKWRR
jgi:pilus assembly protein CpaF